MNAHIYCKKKGLYNTLNNLLCLRCSQLATWRYGVHNDSNQQ